MGIEQKSPRSYYTEAYSQLRLFYASCNEGSYTDTELMNAKLALWKMHGKYLDIVWQHHFARQVSKATGIGSAHGWHNSLRCHQWNHTQAKFGDFRFVHPQWL